MEPYNNTNILQFKVCTKDWKSDNRNIHLHTTWLESADQQQKAWCIWQQIPACHAGLAQSWKLMFPSGAQPPSRVPQCLTEVSAAWARRGPSAGPWPPIITVCVCSGERTAIGQLRGCSNMQQSETAGFPDICILANWILLWFESNTVLIHKAWLLQFGKESKDNSFMICSYWRCKFLKMAHKCTMLH